MKKNNKGLLFLCLISFVMGQVNILGTSLVGLAFYLACMPYYRWGIAVGASTALGSYIAFGMEKIYLNLVVIGISFLIYHLFRGKKTIVSARLQSIGFYGLAGSVVFVIAQIKAGKEISYYINIFAMGIIIYSMSIIFSMGVNYIIKSVGIRKPSSEEIISLTVIGFLGIKAINPLLEGVFSIELTVIFLLVLYGGYVAGGGMGALVGAVGATVFNLGEVAPDFLKMLVMVGIFTIIGGICGALSDINGYLSGGGLILLSGTFYYAMKQDVSTAYMFGSSVVGAGISAGIIFAIWSAFLKRKVVKDDKACEQRSSKYLVTKRLKGYSEAFERLSNSFAEWEEKQDVMGRNDIENIFRLLSENVCAGCQNLENCWEHNYYSTYSDTLDIIDRAWQNGRVDIDVIEVEQVRKCVFIQEFIMQIEMAVEVSRLNIRWRNKVIETKEAFQNQFREVAMVMENAAVTVDSPDYFKLKEKQKITDELEAIGVEVRDIYGVKATYDRLKLVIECRTKATAHVTSKNMAAIVTMVLGREFIMPEDKIYISKEFENYSLYEETKYKVMTGVARVAKSGEKENGDNYSFSNIENGEVVMLLCDGMGSGSNACISSRKVVELMENLMEAGFSWKCAVSFVNAVYAWGGEGKDMYALDMGLVNLYTGTISFVKEGAFATFIKRKNWVESISSVSLPGGIFVKSQMDVVEKKLYNGDFVIMVSDGVGQCLPKGEEIETMEKIIGQINATNPSQVAGKIIEKCVEYNNYVANDDMTVLVLSIWSKSF